MQLLAIALVVAGAALTSLGVVRVTHAAFLTMPRAVAFVILATGAVVVAFGALLPHFVRARQQPTIALQREPTDALPEPVPNGDLRGSVRSVKGDPVPGAKVVLYSSTKKPSTTSSAPDGSYAFHNVAIGGPYRVAVSYGGGLFAKVVLVPSPPVQITVAPVTTSPATVTATAASLAVVGDTRGVQAVYAATLENASDKAYTGGVPLPVLPGAMAVEPRSGTDQSQLAVQDGTLFSSAPVLPGSTSISYTYVAPMPEGGVDATTDVTFPTTRFDLLVAGGVNAKTHGHANGTVRLGGRTYRRYTWRDLKAGDAVPARVAVSSPVPLLRTGAIAAGGVLAAIIVLFPLLRRRRRAPAATPAPLPANR